MAALVSIGATACTGSVGAGGELPPADNLGPGGGPLPAKPGAEGTPVTPAACRPDLGPALGGSPLRRLTIYEYDNTVRDLLGESSRPGQMLPQEAITHGFRNNADAATVDEGLVDRYRAAAELMSVRASTSMATLAECDPAAAGEDVCALSFVKKFGRRAWRRPLQDDETVTLLNLYKTGRQGGTFASGIALVTQALLQSAPFLYRIELGLPAGAEGKLTRLSSWETASRLSYLLWGSMPDAELFAVAERGQLETPAQIRLQAKRMLAQAPAKAQVAAFHTQWLSLDEIDHAEKDSKAFPNYTPAIADLFRTETARFLDHVLWDGAGSGGAWQDLLTAPFTFADPVLAKYYGLPSPRTNTFERVSLEGTSRLGLLTQGAFLASQAKANQTSPVLRGKFVRERLLCQQLPPPPPDVETKAPEPDPGLTTRERFAQHSTQPACAGCHKLMDPIGLGFENFDAAAGWRTTENGKPIDASGDVTSSDVDGAFTGAPDLVSRLGRSEDVRQCLGLQWFRFSFGRLEQESDACSLAAIVEKLGPGSTTEDLLLAVVASDAFMYRSTAGAL